MKFRKYWSAGLNLIWRQTRRRHVDFVSLHLLVLRKKGRILHWHACADLARRRGYIPNPLATSVLERVGGQYHAPVVLQPWRTRHVLYGWLSGRRCRSGQVRKNTLSPGFDGQTIQSVACHYTDMRKNIRVMETDLMHYLSSVITSINLYMFRACL